MALFGKKKEGEQAQGQVQAGPKDDIPTDQVIQLRQQGISNNQIMSELQNQGYSSEQVSDAMSQADISNMAGGSGVIGSGGAGQSSYDPSVGQEAGQGNPGMPPPPPSGANLQDPMSQQANNQDPYGQPGMGMPPPPDVGNTDMGQGYSGGYSGGMPGSSQQQTGVSGNDSSKQAVEQIVEGIVDEKWEELMKNVEKIVVWKDDTERKITKMEQKIADLKDRFDKLHAGILGKVEEYDKSIKSVGTDIKAMESVFKKILPSFTENVSKLSRLTTKMNKKKSSSK